MRLISDIPDISHVSHVSQSVLSCLCLVSYCPTYSPDTQSRAWGGERERGEVGVTSVVQFVIVRARAPCGLLAGGRALWAICYKNFALRSRYKNLSCYERNLLFVWSCYKNLVVTLGFLWSKSFASKLYGRWGAPETLPSGPNHPM